MKKQLNGLMVIAVFLGMLASCRKDDFVNTPPAAVEEEALSKQGKTIDAAKCGKISAQVAIDWMDTYRTVVRTEAKNPPQASRIYAYAAMGLYEVVAGNTSLRSLEGQVAGLSNVPKANRFGRIDITLAANEAMYQIAKSIFVTLKPQSNTLIDSLRNDYISDAAALGNTVISNSVNYGQQVAAAVLNRAAADGFAATRSLVYTVPSQSVNPAFWAPTGPVTSPLEPYWGTLRPFALPNGAASTIFSTIPFSTTPGSAFYNQALEVANTVNNLNQSQKDIALWWADATGTPTPPGHWVSIENIIATTYNLNLNDAARMYAAVNMAMADAFISCWNEKYRFNLLRPVSYIRSYIAGQSTWTSFIGTPPFPEYPSGHSVCSGAAADMLTRLFGNNVRFTDNSNTSLGITARNFTSFNQAAGEACISRLYGGIHFREAIEKGELQGRIVSRTLAQRIRF